MPATVTNPAGKRITYLYDAAVQRTDMTDPGGNLTTYTYYADGRISDQRVVQDGSYNWLYDDAGRVTREQPLGFRVEYTYDDADRVTKKFSYDRTSLVTVTRFDYKYDNAGNRTRVKDVLGELTTWTYDKTYRLTRERHAGTVTYDTTYTYDPAGNRTLKTATGARTTYSYNAGNQLTRLVDSTGVTTFSYDANGNQTKKRAQAGATVNITTYTWDYENRLTKALLPSGTRNTYTYNGDGQRVKVERPTETRKQIWDEARIIEETDGAGAVQTNYRQEPAGYGNLMTQRRGTARDMIHSDALGSTAIITHHTDDTIVRARIWYDAWANQVKTSGSPSITPMRFVGRLGYYRDDDTGLYLMSARFYDPVTGRFVSTDPLGDVDGPNLYVYVANNPVNAVDPSGLLFGWGYGRYCGFSRRATCPPGSGPAPIDAVDAACERHDCCLSTIWDLWKLTWCNSQFCGEVHNAWWFGCSQSWPFDEAKREACKTAAQQIASVFCLPWEGIPGVDPPEGGCSPG